MNVGGSLGDFSAAANTGRATSLQGRIDWRIPVSYLGTVALTLVSATNPLFHLLAGAYAGRFLHGAGMVTTLSGWRYIRVGAVYWWLLLGVPGGCSFQYFS